MAKKWLDYCSNSHSSCISLESEEAQLPSRVLDLCYETLTSDDRLRLVETSDLTATATYEYVTLSHRWGNPPPPETTTRNMDKHKECILLNELPRTFRDAVAFVKVMNVRYLWVDSLCILQDSREDKEREIPMMD